MSNEDGSNQENTSYLDTSLDNHMCGSKESISELDESFSSKVRFGNDTRLPVKGKGKISTRLKNGGQNSIADVLYVPSLHQNLPSVGQLSEKGYDVHINQNV